MLGTTIEEAALFYNEIKKRQTIYLSDELKGEVKSMVKEMHHFYHRRHTPRVKTGKHCLRCSLRHICLPELLNKEKVLAYMDRMLKN